MRTRRGLLHPKSDPKLGPHFETEDTKHSREELGLGLAGNGGDFGRKRLRIAGTTAEERIAVPNYDFFDGLSDDLIVSILSKLSSSADSPSDLISVLLTCKRLNGIGLHPLVLSKASMKSLSIRAKNWSESAHRFLKLCSDARNLEASYILGMIRFYCLEMRRSGASLMAKAAIGSHAAALYSLAVIKFNGTGGTKTDKNPRAGFALCARAALLCHVDAIRELGHCLIDGHGVSKNLAQGRRFLIHADTRELIGSSSVLTWDPKSSLLSDFGWRVPNPDPHPANRFLMEWFGCGLDGKEEGMRMCSYAGCGRRETRRHEFRRCAVCGSVNYCSRACQARDWRVAHKAACCHVDRWALGAGAVDARENSYGGGGGEMEL